MAASDTSSLKQIPVAQVRLGMHLHAMEGAWLDHPFWKTRFVLRDPADLKLLRASKVPSVWINTALGIDVPAPGDGLAGLRQAASAPAAAAGGRRMAALGDAIAAPAGPPPAARPAAKTSMAEEFPDITVLETQFNDNDANKAASQLQGVFARDADLKGVFGANLFSALGAATGVQQAGQTGVIKVVAFDAPVSIVDNIKTGLVDVAIAQHPAEIGYFGVVSAFAHLTGNSIPVSIGTGFTIMDASNIDNPEVAKYLYSE